jgi:hypothetical protein
MAMPSGIGPAFAIFRKLFPTKELATMSPAEIAALGKIYTKWEVIALPFVLGYAAATGYAWFLLFRFLGGLAARSHREALHVLVSGETFWFFPALLGDRYDEYMTWTNLRHKFDGWKVFRIMAVLFIVASALFVAGGMLTWVEFRDDRVILNRPWPVRTANYPYSRVDTVAHIALSPNSDGKLVPRPYYAIRFDDGETWTSFELTKPGGVEPYDEIFALVSERSGRPIRRLDQFSELKP